MSRSLCVVTVMLGWTFSSAACATIGIGSRADGPASERARLIADAQIWRSTDIRSADLKTGPRVKGAFPFRATVNCQYVDKSFSGNTPKFACDAGGGDVVKVKYGGANGEVYGEVLATRLLWALGFGADAMFPVNVICRGCPDEFGGMIRSGRESRFEPAVIEREMPGVEWPRDGRGGWSWRDLDEVAPSERGASRAQRDALKLLAVFLQHTDSKPEQQRILCLGGAPRGSDTCVRPFLMINDLGRTFGRASRSNADSASSVNLEAWRDTPVWTDERRCTGNLPKSFSGTLDNPTISEDGRRFLANLLAQLSDGQIRDLFEVARVELRLRNPGDVSSGFATVDQWVAAFKAKRTEIANRRCT